jgi:hypothetical protein
MSNEIADLMPEIVDRRHSVIMPAVKGLRRGKESCQGT